MIDMSVFNVYHVATTMINSKSLFVMLCKYNKIYLIYNSKHNLAIPGIH
jgi:hypothetical protein